MEISIGLHHAPFIIAEMSGNHNQSLSRALAIVEAAAKCGVHALKLQTYTADTLTLDVSEGEFLIHDPDNLWQGNSLHQLYQQAHTPWEWHQPIFERCRQLNLVPFSTPFDESAVDFLETLDVPIYKIASFENNHLPLIKKVAQTKKPMIMSTGMATLEELDEAVQTAKDNGCPQLILLKCTSTYPATPEDSNIKTIPDLRERFGVESGLSDHTMGIGAALASIALGAVVIEKHFTLSRADGGVDSAFSMEPAEMTQLVTESLNAWKALGTVCYTPTEKEKKSRIFRRSIYVSQDIQPGERLTSHNIKIIRPGMGLQPREYERVLEQTANQFLKKGTALSWELIKDLI